MQTDPRQHTAKGDYFLGADDIRRTLPLRYPMLLIDRVVSSAPGECVVIKNLTLNEACFNGHYPERAIYPGSLLMESMAQSAYFMGKGEEEASVPNPQFAEGFLLAVEIKFHRVTVPGDQVVIRTRLLQRMQDSIRYKSEAHVDGELAARGVFTAYLRLSEGEAPGA
jgi:3-hydroxyacyl-[acyl-carrier-protein] dehydratase